MSVVLHDLANTTQYLSALNHTLREDPSAAAEALGGLSDTTGDVDQIGFVLGLVAHAAGADVLHSRARRDGLDVLLVFVKRALRREQRDLRLDDRTRSRLEIDTPDRGRGATWAAARFVFAAGRALPPQSALTFEIDARRDPARLVCQAARTPDLDGCAGEIAADDARFAFEFAADTSTLVFPAGAIETEPAS